MSFDFRIGGDAQQTYATSTARNSATEENEIQETRLTMGKSSGGDTVSISQAGQEKLAAMTSMKSASEATEESSDSSSSIDDQIERIKEQIEKIKKELERLQKDPEKNKDQIAAKQNELMQMQSQLAEMQDQKAKASGTNSSGGTRAEGMSNSLT
ncbi:hypothetical protein [Maridesulfovibrio sp.]|uniref:hypothetical protein n=1 Tax=Maridesulfovibrio sp. TaxID=2795000 RepID=UPI002A187F60|nr:hypothetical protein [Maridesulfovibrio sp.]